MSATILLDAIVARTRALFTKQQVAEVREYAGEFNSAEIGKVSFNAPAILVSILGWSNAKDSMRMGNVRNARLNQCVAFVVTKGAKREVRMRQAAELANALGYGLMAWTPMDHAVCAIGGIEDEPEAENLYGRAIDEAGLALWMVSWSQATRPLLPPDQVFDLLAVEITSDAVHELAADEPPGGDLVVTESLEFKPTN